MSEKLDYASPETPRSPPPHPAAVRRAGWGLAALFLLNPLFTLGVTFQFIPASAPRAWEFYVVVSCAAVGAITLLFVPISLLADSGLLGASFWKYMRAAIGLAIFMLLSLAYCALALLLPVGVY